MKRNVKLIATIVAAVMLVMSLASISASAEGIGKNYITLDLNKYGANAKFFVDPENTTETNVKNYKGWDGTATITTGGYVDFLAYTNGYPSAVAAAWPFSFCNWSSKVTVKRNAYIMQDNSLRTKTGIPYLLPAKTDSVDKKEVITINDSGYNYGRDVYAVTTKPTNEKIDKIHFIVANSANLDMSGKLHTYYDGATSPSESHDFEIKKINNDENGLPILPDNFLGTINHVAYWNGHNDDLMSEFDAMQLATRVTLYEFSVDVDETKSLDRIRFGGSTAIGKDYAIIGITLETVADASTHDLIYGEKNTEDGSYSVTVSAPVAGRAVLAVYDNAAGNKLIAVKLADLTVGNQTQTITAESENIKAGTEYAAQVMLLDGIDTLVPLTNALPIG